MGLACLTVSLMWAFAMPLFSAPDEPSHVIRAAGVNRGQLVVELGERPTARGVPAAPGATVVPAGYAASHALAGCTAFQPEQSAECMQPLAEGLGEMEVDSFTANYPPLYYALVGWPSLIDGGDEGVFAMRAVSGVLFAAFVMAGLLIMPRRAGYLVGAATALPPSAWYLGSVVNSNGLEIATGFSFCAGMLVLTRIPGSQHRATVWAVTAVSLIALLNMRTTSPVWAAVIVVTACLAARSGQLRRAVRSPGFVITAALATVASVVALFWTTGPGVPAQPVGVYPEYRVWNEALADSLGNTRWYVEHMIANFGWLDTPGPYATIVIWSVVLSALVVAGLVLGRWRDRAAIGLLLVALVAMPSLIQVPLAADIGLVWQGRYLLPLAVALPLLVGFVVEEVVPHDVLSRLASLILPALAVAHLLSFYWVLRRYVVGTDGPFIRIPAEWEPPMGWLVALAAMAVALALFTWVLLTSARGRNESADAPTATAQ